MFHFKTTRPEPTAHLGGLKPQPQISELPQALIFVSRKINDGQFATLVEGAPGLGERHRRGRYVMQHHTRHDGVDLAIAHRQVFEIAQSEIAPTDIGAGRSTCQIEHGS
mgnify:CR=1 FL=1|jgi:hypothetical protein